MRRLLKARVGPVNLLAYAYAGSNPALPTILILRKLQEKAQLNELGFFFGAGHLRATFNLHELIFSDPV